MINEEQNFEKALYAGKQQQIFFFTQSDEGQIVLNVLDISKLLENNLMRRKQTKAFKAQQTMKASSLEMDDNSLMMRDSSFNQ